MSNTHIYFDPTDPKIVVKMSTELFFILYTKPRYGGNRIDIYSWLHNTADRRNIRDRYILDYMSFRLFALPWYISIKGYPYT